MSDNPIIDRTSGILNTLVTFHRNLRSIEEDLMPWPTDEERKAWSMNIYLESLEHSWRSLVRSQERFKALGRMHAALELETGETSIDEPIAEFNEMYRHQAASLAGKLALHMMDMPGIIVQEKSVIYQVRYVDDGWYAIAATAPDALPDSNVLGKRHLNQEMHDSYRLQMLFYYGPHAGPCQTPAEAIAAAKAMRLELVGMTSGLKSLSAVTDVRDMNDNPWNAPYSVMFLGWSGKKIKWCRVGALDLPMALTFYRSFAIQSENERKEIHQWNEQDRCWLPITVTDEERSEIASK